MIRKLSPWKRMVMRATLATLLGSMAIWVLAPDLRTYAAGFALGFIVSFINGLLLYRRLDHIVETVLRKEGKRATTGSLERIAVTLVGVMISLRFEQHFDLLFTIVGICMATILFICLAMYVGQKSELHNGKE